MNDEYILVPWPESQDYMEEEWFNKEAFLEYEGKTGSSAYFIPKKYINPNPYLDRVLNVLSYGSPTSGKLQELIAEGTVDPNVPQDALDHIREVYPEFDTYWYVYDYRNESFGKFLNLAEEIISNLIESLNPKENGS